MKIIYRLTLTSIILSLCACSSGHVYFGDDPDHQDSTGGGTRPDQAALTDKDIRELAGGFSTSVHEVFTPISSRDDGWEVVLVLPRATAHRAYLIFAQTEYVDAKSLRFTMGCWSVVQFSIGEPQQGTTRLPLVEEERQSEENSPCNYEVLNPELIDPVVDEDLANNQAHLVSATTGEVYFSFAKRRTIAPSWRQETSSAGPMKLLDPKAQGIGGGFLTWGKSVADQSAQLFFYDVSEDTWVDLFTAEQAPHRDTIVAMEYLSARLLVLTDSGQQSWDPIQKIWQEPVAVSTDAIHNLTVKMTSDGSSLFVVAKKESRTVFFRIEPSVGVTELATGLSDVPAEPNGIYWDGRAVVTTFGDSDKVLVYFPDAQSWKEINGSDASAEFLTYRLEASTVVRYRDFQSHRISESYDDWESIDAPAHPRPGSVRASDPSGRWVIEWGGLDSSYAVVADGYFSAVTAPHEIYFPGDHQPLENQPTLPGLAWSANRLFVIGGCLQWADAQCLAYSDKVFSIPTFVSP